MLNKLKQNTRHRREKVLTGFKCTKVLRLGQAGVRSLPSLPPSLCFRLCVLPRMCSFLSFIHYFIFIWGYYGHYFIFKKLYWIFFYYGISSDESYTCCQPVWPLSRCLPSWLHTAPCFVPGNLRSNTHRNLFELMVWSKSNPLELLDNSLSNDHVSPQSLLPSTVLRKYLYSWRLWKPKLPDGGSGVSMYWDQSSSGYSGHTVLWGLEALSRASSCQYHPLRGWYWLYPHTPIPQLQSSEPVSEKISG